MMKYLEKYLSREKSFVERHNQHVRRRGKGTIINRGPKDE